MELEFKRADKLRKEKERRDLVRSVVAMRNAEGGAIWIGAIEKDERLVGWDPLASEEERLRDQLRDVLVSRVEPPLPLGSDVYLDSVPLAGGWVLCIQVRKRLEGAAFCCVLEGNQREFLRRTDSRTEVIPFHELFATAAGTPAPDLRKVAYDAHRQWHRANEERAGLVVSICHDAEGATERGDDLRARMEKWLALVTSPPSRLARRAGWTWHQGSSAEPPRLVPEDRDDGRRHWRLESGVLDDGGAGYRRLSIDEGGAVHFFTAARHILAQRNGGAHEAARALQKPIAGIIDPYAFVESIASVLRLAGALATASESPERRNSAAVASLEGMQGTALQKGYAGPNYATPDDREDWIYLAGPSLLSEIQLAPTVTLARSPDGIAYRVLRDLYESDPENRARVKPGDIPWFTDEETFAPPI